MLMSRISSVVLRNLSRVSRDDMSSCILVRKMGADTIHSAVVPMWIFYQFMISVVLLRILIVMLTITYKKIYDNMDTQWKYEHLSLSRYIYVDIYTPQVRTC